IDMGGMFAVVKVRDSIDYGRDPGWYEQPRGTSAWKVDSLSTSPAPAAPDPHAGHGK
ncbi:MAG TPA: copper oxidase, partial [Thermoanaerobaculia bacterium]|nr:copper oxidase [Thermoanaerobaculia bacterium]